MEIPYGPYDMGHLVRISIRAFSFFSQYLQFSQFMLFEKPQFLDRMTLSLKFVLNFRKIGQNVNLTRIPLESEPNFRVRDQPNIRVEWLSEKLKINLN